MKSKKVKKKLDNFKPDEGANKKSWKEKKRFKSVKN